MSKQEGVTARHILCKIQQTIMAEYLLRVCSQISSKTMSLKGNIGHTPFLTAIYYDAIDIVKLLSMHFSDKILVTFSEDNFCPVEIAVRNLNPKRINS